MANLERGMSLAKQAVECDSKGDSKSALPLYISSVECLMHAMKHPETSATIKEVLRKKIVEYMSRAEVLKAPESSSSKSERQTANSTENEEETLETSITSSMLTTSPNVRWDDIAGLKATKDVLKSATLLPVSHPEIFRATGTEPFNSILLYGPPGTGKSMLAKAVATECKGCCFFSISSSDVVSKYQGESERLVKALLKLARKRKPSVIFIDEIDSMCRRRTDDESASTRSIKNEIMVQMDGVGKDNAGVIIVGATNVPWELDDAVARRFSKKVYVPLADSEIRRRIVEMKLSKIKHNLSDADVEEIIKRTEKMSGSDMKSLLQDACYGPIHDCQVSEFWHLSKDSGEYSPCFCAEMPSAAAAAAAACTNAIKTSMDKIPAGKLVAPLLSSKHFKAALARAKPTSSDEALQRFEAWEKDISK